MIRSRLHLEDNGEECIEVRVHCGEEKEDQLCDYVKNCYRVCFVQRELVFVGGRGERELSVISSFSGIIRSIASWPNVNNHSKDHKLRTLSLMYLFNFRDRVR